MSEWGQMRASPFPPLALAGLLLGGGPARSADPVPNPSGCWRAELVITDSTASAWTTPIFLRLF